ncbi:hypothetical protein GCM10007416_05750 [Kroppenstedtia guangzhouensis]|uniref:Uncharacterized protein n=1 Tax=Kroppenstedtia guangzhouensis TaxID=1274356 RepID=A0ABQ1G1T2_9BACL|nr:hypothetical protein [Kroppenstedtia guangzhouensis]GGA35754.1 hypothetical protein GCM10007416_05750 [Kroppenstedtia guangzhouensis]
MGFALTVNQVGIVQAPAAFGWLADTGGAGVAWKVVAAGLLGALLLLGKSVFRRRKAPIQVERS